MDKKKYKYWEVLSPMRMSLDEAYSYLDEHPDSDTAARYEGSCEIYTIEDLRDKNTKIPVYMAIATDKWEIVQPDYAYEDKLTETRERIKRISHNYKLPANRIDHMPMDEIWDYVNQQFVKRNDEAIYGIINYMFNCGFIKTETPK